MRSSDVNRFRKRLLALQAQLREQHAAVFDETARHLADEGSVSADRDFEGYEQDVTVANAERDLLDEVSQALGRIEHGAFGKCEGCDVEIDAQRLEALPYARYCKRCAQQRQW